MAHSVDSPLTKEHQGEMEFVAEQLRWAECLSPQVMTQAPNIGVARLAGFDMQEQALVSHVPGLNGHLVNARTIVPLAKSQIGADVVVLFEEGHSDRLIILGVVMLNVAPGLKDERAVGTELLSVDPEVLEISAEREITLRCGDASITLTRAGKVIIKGNYIVSRSSGYNKVKGAAVEIN